MGYDTQPINLSKVSGARVIDNTGQRITIPGGQGTQVRVINAGTNAVCISSTDGVATAAFPTDSATPNGRGCVVLAGATEIFTIGQGEIDLHCICAAAQTATIYVSRGQGN